MNTSKKKKIVNNLGVIITFYLFLIVSITLIINFTLMDGVISKYFSNIENIDVVSKTEQSMKILQSKIREIETLAEPYAFWDENYNKIQQENIDEQWYRENFTEWLPNKYGIDLIVILNRDKKIIVQYGLNNINDILNDNRILKSLNEDKYNKETRVSGLKKYDGDMYMITQCPIFKNTSEGSCQGIVIIGKKVSPSLLESIKKQFGTDIFITYDKKNISGEKVTKEINGNITVINENIYYSVYNLNNLNIIGSLPLIDIAGAKIGNINIIQSREVFLSIQKLGQRNTLVVMGLSIIVIIILWFRFKNIIVKPIKNLENQIKNMEQENSLIHIDLKANRPNEIINLTDSFNHMIAKGHKQISIMFCDIDKFKSTNDTYGHAAGDFVLREVAKIIKDEVKGNGMVFRYGGEEFVVIICDYTSEETLAKAEEIRKKIAKSQELEKYAKYFPITISIGIASYPNHATDAEGLIKKADNAMYYSKQNGRNQCNIYNTNMNMVTKDSNITKKELVIDCVLSLTEAVDAKDKYTGEHSKMVSKYSILLAEKLGLSESEINKLRIGALLHDCGKIGIPDYIINKPEKLTDEEYTVIKDHTLLGYNIIKHMTNDEEIIACIRSHHERWDSKGYPDGLSGNSTHLLARIVCIADVYHAMTSDRPYRKALTHEKVIEEFLKMKGTQCDPELVDAFVEIIKVDM